MEYTNFNLRIESKAGDGDDYQVVVDSDGMGETDGVFTLSADCLKIADELKDIQTLEADSQLPMDLGVSLYQCLFQKKVAKMLYKSLGAVKDDTRGLRIRLRLTPPKIAALPWELLYDQESKCFLATSDKTPLTRYIELAEPIKALKIEPPVKVLTLIPGGSGLDVEKEEQIITQALSELGSVEMRVVKTKVTRSEISRALNAEQYHILHFIGHGTFAGGDGHLLINSEDGGEDLISAKTFADFFRNHPSLKLVVLNACQGAEVSTTEPLAGMAPQLVARGIPAVVAMQYPISDEAALVFAREFYLKLCTGWNRGQVDSAVSHARNRISMDVKEALAFATPVLFLRSPTGVIFDLEKEPEQKSGIFSRFLRLFSSAPAKHVNRLKDVKQTYEKNIEAWQEKTKDASPEAAREAAEAIVNEQKEITAVEERIVKWNRTFLASLFATVMIFALAYVGLFDFPFNFDEWLETRLIPYMDEYVAKKFNPNVRLILAEADDNGGMGLPGPRWREYHASLIDSLTKARAKVIAFDLELSTSTDYDQAFAKAIENAEAQGTHVILAKSIDEEGNTVRDITPVLRNVLHERWGNILVAKARGGLVRVYQLGQRDRSSGDVGASEPAVLPSLALEALANFQSTNSNLKPFFNEDKEKVQLRSDGALKQEIPVYEHSESIYDFPYDLTSRAKLDYVTDSYKDIYDRRGDVANLEQKYGGKIVLIGFKTEGPVRVLQGDRRYGLEIHANVISNIMNNVYVRLLPPLYNFLIIALFVVIGALVRARLSHIFTTRITLPLTGGKKKIDVSGILVAVDVVYLLIAFLLYKNELLYILRYYHLAAPFLAYWLTGKMRQRTALKPAKGVTS